MVDFTYQTAGPIDSTKYEYGQKGGAALVPAALLLISVAIGCCTSLSKTMESDAIPNGFAIYMEQEPPPE